MAEGQSSANQNHEDLVGLSYSYDFEGPDLPPGSLMGSVAETQTKITSMKLSGPVTAFIGVTACLIVITMTSYVFKCKNRRKESKQKRDLAILETDPTNVSAV
eukprot:CAMPEP_0194560042 /NCGR_PEP_ID=MMETSP0292-20121207/1368_1 /TAXON_ID=39354 /ORGANISM="Heterosigma akashiwo, Strain CCMP2393" /LENGTH=102 /DNA_ID=CAMNT_0039408117 /DNA_START=46 /DNA_END=354 /DNA_ORIENTATION=-